MTMSNKNNRGLMISREPDDDPIRKIYRSGQLAGYYWDWELLYCAEEIKEAKGAGRQKRAVNTIIVRKKA